MIAIRKIFMVSICLIFISSFSVSSDSHDELNKLIELEKSVLKKNVIGKVYISNLTNLENCNKTKIEYLGIAKTKTGKQYKILTSFFVFATSKEMCHGTSNIKIYSMENRYLGRYYVGMPESLPDSLQNSKLIYLKNSEECTLRKTGVIDFKNGLPKQIFIPCSKNGGDLYSFE